MLLSAELYGQYVSLALRSEAVDTGNMTEITLVRQNIGRHTSSPCIYNDCYKVDLKLFAFTIQCYLQLKLTSLIWTTSSFLKLLKSVKKQAQPKL